MTITETKRMTIELEGDELEKWERFLRATAQLAELDTTDYGPAQQVRDFIRYTLERSDIV